MSIRSRVPLSSLLLLVPSLGLALPTGCGDDDANPSDADGGVEPDAGAVLLEPPAPGEGVQLQLITELPAGTEGERCKFVVGSDEEMWVTRDQVRFTAGSHHFLLYETSYDTIPTERDDGTPVDTSTDFDCSDGATNGWSVTKLVGGSQNGDGDSLLAFPEGVAMRVRAGAVLLMNAHYVNASDQPLQPEVRINLYTVPAESVTTEGDLLFLYNPFIKVPANGTARAHWRCPVYSDITIANVQSHMHRRGVGYAAALVGEPDPIYENDLWEGVPVKKFEPGLQVAAGSTFDYYCDYENGEDRTIYQGARSTDEMCMLIGSYYPVDSRTAGCRGPNGEQLAGEWVGSGEATCAETFGCFVTAFGNADVVPAITDCLMAARPEVAPESSAVLTCFAGTEGDPTVACQTQIEACQAK